MESTYRYLFDSGYGPADQMISRWLFLRAMGAIYFSAFFALLFQIRGLIGPHGILPAREYLQALLSMGALRFWFAPSLFWLSGGNHMLMTACWAGLIASVFLLVNVWPRAMLLLCFVCFVSFVSAAQDFSGYQSDGMLLEAGFLSLFLAPSGITPGLAIGKRPVRAAALLLLWEWFRIYFESGVVKLASGDPTWRNLTAMYEYYQNGPLPTWIGWYLQHLPNWFHIATAAATLVMELVLVWIALLSRPWKIACFFIVTVWQIAVIATANYTFLNYLVLALAVLLLDDAFFRHLIPSSWLGTLDRDVKAVGDGAPEETHSAVKEAGQARSDLWATIRTVSSAVMLTWIFYATVVPFVQMAWHDVPLSTKPVAALEPLRIANQYGLFAVMTPHRYEIEFQGSNDGENWIAYPFRYKPQGLKDRPRIYAPYQPRFDWNLWFASLGSWQQNLFVPRTEERLLENDHDVLELFSGNPFPDAPPRLVRAVLWQYWFSSLDQMRTDGVWWRRQLIGDYAPTLTKLPYGRFGVVDEPAPNPFRQP